MLNKRIDDGNIGTIRKNLCGNRSRHQKFIDMEWVYRELDRGRTRQDVADEFGVHPNTLYLRHKKYQKQLEVLKNINESDTESGNLMEEELPPIPPEFRI